MPPTSPERGQSVPVQQERQASAHEIASSNLRSILLAFVGLIHKLFMMKNPRLPAAMRMKFLVLTLISPNLSWGQLVPDDPSISSHLAVWLKDASTNFNPATGIWSDSSGKGHHAVPVGEVNVAELRTFLPPTPSMVPGDGLSANDLTAVRFGADVEDLLVVEELNGGIGLSDLTILVVYRVDPLAALRSQVRPVGIGSISSLQRNPGGHFNLGSDPSIRKDNGQIGAGAYSQPFPDQTTFIRIARMSANPDTIDEWFRVDGPLEKVLSVPGVSFTTSTDHFFLGDLRAGATGTPGVMGSNDARSDFDIVQTIVYTTALTDSQIEGLSDWLITDPAGLGDGPRAGGLAFTDISLTADRLSASLTWRSRPGQTYAIDLSSDLTKASWLELNDSIPSEGETTTIELPTFAGNAPNPLPQRIFYRVREVSSN